MLLTITILFSILGSLGALAVAGLFMLLKEDRRRGLIPYLVAFATGTLLTVALVGLIPEALEELGAKQVMQTVLIGMVAIFVLEKIFIWRHCHAGNCEKHDTGAVMICIGDAAHNFVDGVMMAAAFLTSIPMGIAVGLSAFLHEIPQEVGDFGILLHNGWSRKKAIFWNTLVGLSTVPAAIAAYFALEQTRTLIPYVMAVSAASFIYIALVDLTPEMHKQTGGKKGAAQILTVLSGIAVMLIVFALVHE